MGGIWGYDWKLRSIIIIQNITLIILFVGGGFLLDRYFTTKPMLLLIGLITSFIVNQLVSIRIIAWYIKGKPVYNPQDPRNQESSSSDTDDSSLV